MKRKIVNFTWDDEDAQAVFAERCPFPDSSATSEDVDRIEMLAGIAPPLRVMDVGCGNGRHSIEMARRLAYSSTWLHSAKHCSAQAVLATGPTIDGLPPRSRSSIHHAGRAKSGLTFN
jgi:hypothetical protein